LPPPAASSFFLKRSHAGAYLAGVFIFLAVFGLNAALRNRLSPEVVPVLVAAALLFLWPLASRLGPRRVQREGLGLVGQLREFGRFWNVPTRLAEAAAQLGLPAAAVLISVLLLLCLDVALMVLVVR
jgi:hypothetical protein